MIPYKVDVWFERRPYANWGLIAVTVAVFLLQLSCGRNVGAWRPYMCTGWANPVGWFTSIFLHASIMHIAGNMLFLWVFGNAVCSKVGNKLYIPLYMAAGLAGNIAQMTSDPITPGLGASGAINGMVGLYLVFFPLNEIDCFMWFWMRPILFSLAGYWVILYFLAWDMFGAALGGGNVGHWAHLGGILSGFGMGIMLLELKIVTMNKDEVSLLQAIGLAGHAKNGQSGNTPSDFYAREMQRMQEEREAALSAQATDPLLVTPKISGPRPVPMSRPKEVTPRPSAGAVVRSATNNEDELIEFVCPCGKMIKAPVRLKGKHGKCPKCGTVVPIP